MIQGKAAKDVALDYRHVKDCLELRSMVVPVQKQHSPSDTIIRQLTRLQWSVDDIAEAQVLTASNPILKSYDIVAVCPGSQKVFAHLCKSADIDIITFDFSHRIPFAIDKKLVLMLCNAVVTQSLSSCAFAISQLLIVFSSMLQ